MKNFKFAKIPSYFSMRHKHDKTNFSGVVAKSEFTLIQDDKIKGFINGNYTDLTLDDNGKFAGTIGERTVNMILTASGSIAILSGVFEDEPVDIKIRRGWLSTSIKGKGIDLELEYGVFSLSENDDYEGEYRANADLIPFIISIVQSIADEEELYFAAA
jgi:hypothetical protein